MMRILHVDDESLILELTQLFLERTGEMQITSCTSAEEALGLIETAEFDAVISDYEMPGMNGIDFLFELRSAGIPIPFIIFTGRGREEVVIEALNQGADFYIQKGGEAKSQFAELRNAVRRAVEKHRFEQEVRESERRITEIFHHLPDATFAIDCSGKVIAWNRAMEAMTGVAAGEIIGTGAHAYARPFYDVSRPSLVDALLHPDEEVPSSYTLVQREPGLIIAETAEASLNGEQVVLWAKATLLYGEDGNVAGAIESVRDITAQKQAEKEVISAGEYRRTLIEAHIDPLVTIGPDRRISDVNAATEALTGRTRDTLIGTEFCALFTDPVGAEEAYWKVIADGTVREHPLVVRGVDGGIRSVLFYGTVYRDGEGETRGVFAELHDPLPGGEGSGECGTIGSPLAEAVSGIVAASVTAGSADAFLKAALEAVQDLPEIGGGCIVRYDEHGTLSVVRQEDCGPFDEIVPGLQGYEGSPVAPFAEETRDGRGDPVVHLPLTDGEEALGLLCLSVRVPDLSVYEGHVALDLSADLIGALYVQMRRNREGEAAERIAALHFDIVAHDLANAVSAALGYADLIDEMVDGEARIVAEKMTRAIRKGQEVIRNLKTLRKIGEIRNGTAALQEVSLDAAIKNEISHFPGIEIAYAESGAVVLADDLIGEIFWNLFDNSVRYSGKGVSILVGVREDGDRVEVMVEDDGPGIPEKICEDLSSKVRGHGLCIVRDLAACYGGGVSIGDRVPGRPREGAAVGITFRKAEGGWSSSVGLSGEDVGVPETRV
ncbi:response regulator [Methanofollis formosanus]|uniref:histidine kinase n=1 Tax=Methanofollis formosanus TaxID=299308 RepID=A0A8G1A077_9EURY|nr:response regulator [Methanofollis formosanus]QYZ78621.1 response regulator [Methanofollis formosanus]